MVWYECEEYEEAGKAFDEGVKYEPDHQVWATMSLWFVRNVRKHCKSLRKNTILLQVRRCIAKGRQAFESEEYDLAVSYFNDAIKHNPKNCTYYVYRAVTYMAKKNLDLAEQDALKVIQLQPNWPKVIILSVTYIDNKLAKSKEDWLSPEAKVNVMKKKRWFILKNYFIYYYDSSKVT